jgi:fatty acid desaturase
MDLKFKDRELLSDYEWELYQKFINRCDVDRDEVRRLSERSNLHGIVRVTLYVGALVLAAWGAVGAARIHWALAIPILYLYWFLYGFWVALGHELQHKIVFAKSMNAFSEFIYFFVQVFMWNSPCYARISHQLHHRCTMVRGVDPETDWPEVITTPWLRKYLRGIIFNILVVGAPLSLFSMVKQQIDRIAGKKDRMMRNHCSEKDCRTIRIESAAILLIHLAVALSAVVLQIWWPILFVTIAWQVGSAMETLWHSTEHIGRMYNSNDQRLATRSVKVGPLLRLLYGGLDDHVDHHVYPWVPSRNLPELHRLMGPKLAEPRGMIACWCEMFAIAREKDVRPQNEHVPVSLILTD